MDNPFQIGDPVMDAAQGRAMLVLDAPDQTVEDWSDANNYDLEGNYANSKFDPLPKEPVVECVYVSDVRSEPSKTYTFPVSRVVLIDAHHADEGRRVRDRIVVDVLEQLFIAHRQSVGDTAARVLSRVAAEAGLDDDLVSEARELADVELNIGGDDA